MIVLPILGLGATRRGHGASSASTQIDERRMLINIFLDAADLRARRAQSRVHRLIRHEVHKHDDGAAAFHVSFYSASATAAAARPSHYYAKKSSSARERETRAK